MGKDKILITGGSGFLGSELLKKLKNKTVFVLSNKEFINKFPKHKNIKCNLLNKKKLIEKVEKINPTIVYHLAWYGIPTFNKKNFKINLKITENLVAAVNNSNCKKILISGSCAEYGNKRSPLTENMKIGKIHTPLGYQKNIIRKYFFKNLNKNIVCLWTRIFYVYGKNTRKGSLTNLLLECKKNNKSIEIKKPNIFNDYIHVNDVVKAFLKISNKINRNSIINICSGKPLSNLEFVNFFQIVKSIKFKIICPNKSKKTKLYGSNKKLRSFGWKQNLNINKGLKNI